MLKSLWNFLSFLIYLVKIPQKGVKVFFIQKMSCIPNWTIEENWFKLINNISYMSLLHYNTYTDFFLFLSRADSNSRQTVKKGWNWKKMLNLCSSHTKPQIKMQATWIIRCSRNNPTTPTPIYRIYLRLCDNVFSMHDNDFYIPYISIHIT